MFRFFVDPESVRSEGDRGPDTVNRLVLHGARYHDRPAVFRRREEKPETSHQVDTPDWKADRYSIRIALFLSQRLHIGSQEPVAIWLPLGVDFALIERGLWMFGAVSLPLWPEWGFERAADVLGDARPSVLFALDREAIAGLRSAGGLPDSVRRVIVMNGPTDESSEALSFADCLYFGGILDTAERAAMLRTRARSILPEDPISLDYPPDENGHSARVIRHRDLMKVIDEMAPRAGREQRLESGRPDIVSRAALYAGWADGWTSTVLNG